MYLREIRNKKDKTKMGCYNDDHERKIVRNRNVYCFENAENSENLEKKEKFAARRSLAEGREWVTNIDCRWRGQLFDPPGRRPGRRGPDRRHVRRHQRQWILERYPSSKYIGAILFQSKCFYRQNDKRGGQSGTHKTAIVSISAALFSFEWLLHSWKYLFPSFLNFSREKEVKDCSELFLLTSIQHQGWFFLIVDIQLHFHEMPSLIKIECDFYGWSSSMSSKGGNCWHFLMWSKKSLKFLNERLIWRRNFSALQLKQTIRNIYIFSQKNCFFASMVGE